MANSILKTKHVLIISGVILLTASYLWISIKGSEIAKEIISGIIKVQSNDRYNVEFKKVDLSILDKVLVIDSMSLVPSSSDPKRNIYIISSPKLIIDLKSVSAIFFDKILSIEQISVVNPYLKIVKGDIEKPKTLTFEAGNLYQLLSKYIKVFEVGQLKIIKGDLDLTNKHTTNKDFRIQEIDLLVENFLMDSSQTKDRFFFTDKIKLILTNQVFPLNDNLHTVRFDTLAISTKEKNLAFRGFSITPNDTIPDSASVYNIKVPSFELVNVDFDRAYLENKLYIGSVNMRNANFDIELKNLQTKKSEQPRIFTSFNQFVAINHVDINFDNSKIKINDNQILFDLLTFSGNGLKIDSTTTFKDFDEIIESGFIELKKPIFKNANNAINADSIKFVTSDHTLSIYNYAFDNKEGIQLNGQSITAELIDGKINEIAIQMLTMNDPSFSINALKKSKKKKSISMPSWLKIEELQLIDAQFDIAQTVRMSGVNSNIKINELFKFIKNKEFNNFKKFHASANKWSYSKQEVKLTGSNLTVTKDRDITTEDIYFRNNTSNITIESIDLDDLDIDKFIQDSQLVFDTLKINRPIGEISVSNENDSSRFNYLFNQTLINNADLIIHLPDQTEINLTSLNSSINRSEDTYTYTLDLLRGYIPQLQEHSLEIKNLNIVDSTQSMSLGVFEVAPLKKDQHISLNIKGQNLLANNLRIKDLINKEGALKLGKSTLDSLTINGSISTEEFAKNSKDKRPIQLERLEIPNLNTNLTFNGHNLQLKNGDFQIDQFDNSIEQPLVESKIKLYSQHFNYSGDSLEVLVDSLSFNSSLQLIASKSTSLFLKKDTITFKSIVLDGLQFSALKDSILIENVHVDQPHIRIDLAKTNSNEKIKLPVIKLSKLNISNGIMDAQNTGVKFNSNITIPDINIEVNRFELLAGLESLAYDDFNFSIGSLAYDTPDSLYRISTNQVSLNSKGNLKISDIAFTPFYNRKEFQEKIEFQKDWFNGRIKSVEIKNWDFHQIFNDSAIQISSIAINSLYLETHKDKRLPEPENTFKYLPQQQLKELNFGVHIDSIIINNAYVSHSEYSETGTRPGFIYFNNINGQLDNITNIPERLEKNNLLTFNARGMLYKTGNFMLTTKFQLDHPKNLFNMTARVGNMDLTEMNALLENTAHISIRSGMNRLNELNFDANDHYALGEMKFYYKDLKLDVLKETKNEHEENASFKSFFANAFIVNKKNPHFLFVRKGDIYFERDDEKAIFNYWARSILSGAITSIGAGSKKKEIRALNKASK